MKMKALTLGVAFALSGSVMATDFSKCANTPNPNEANLFNASICIDGVTKPYNGNTAEGLIDQFKSKELQERFKEWYKEEGTDTSTGLFIADFRGLEMRLSYPYGKGKEKSHLIFKVPSLNIDKRFKGTTRDESNEQLKDYLKKDDEGSRILKELIRKSAFSAIAGNPNSAQSKMNDSDFSEGTGMGFEQHRASAIGIGFNFGRYKQDGRQVNAFTLPLSTSFEMGEDDELSFRVPITYVEVEGAKSYSIIVGASYKKLMNKHWSLTPSLNYGIAASEDLGEAAQMASASLTSNYMLVDDQKYSISMGNMIGYFKTLPLDVGDYSVDPDLTNQIVRNGLMFSKPIGMLGGKKLTMDTFVTDTRILGDDVFMDQYNEIGFAIGPQQGGWKDDLRTSSQEFGIGISYLRSSSADISGFQLTFGYKF